jgi:hypothetical protein
LGYEVHILTQNEVFPVHFNSNIIFHDIVLKGNLVFKFFFEGLKNQYHSADVIVVCDNGLKAYLIPFILKNKIPLVLEMHSSKFIEERESKDNFLTKVISKGIRF